MNLTSGANVCRNQAVQVYIRTRHQHLDKKFIMLASEVIKSLNLIFRVTSFPVAHKVRHDLESSLSERLNKVLRSDFKDA